MFKKKSMSFRGMPKEVITGTTSSSPAPAAAASTPKVLAVPKPAPIPPKIEVSKPAGPPSIVPPGTKRVLVVGKGVVMVADVENCDAVIVQGNLDGNIKAKYIVIMKGGCMRGKVECEEADVAGSFEGMEMTVHNRLTLSATARVGGRTTYNRLSVHDGAILTGELVYKPAKRTTSPSKKAIATKKPDKVASPAAAPAPAATPAPASSGAFDDDAESTAGDAPSSKPTTSTKEGSVQ